MDRIKKAVHNLSVKKSFMLYMLLFLLLATVLSSISIGVADNMRNRINLSYANRDNQYTVSNGDGMIVIFSSPVEYTAKDKAIITICNYIQIGSVPLFFGLCIISAALLFYRNKLKRPIELLSGASKKIAANDLDFRLSYDSSDEMGQLCTSFESMRGALEENYRTIWRTMEERKRLNAAFSHDLRTPLTVLRGYADFLRSYLPQGKIAEEKLLSTISTMSEHIDRLEKYVSQMSETQKLDDITLNTQDVDAGAFIEQLQTTAELLAKGTGIIMDFTKEIEEDLIHLDASIVMRVYENLISNALRYAKSTVCIRCRCEGKMFLLDVADDGQGFSKDALKQATEPYYKAKADTDRLHSGLGLFICKILCEKHGGKLAIGNAQKGGASITASFSIK